ncbi:VC2046/SO_2500 family protein [Psychromonas sp. MME2]|uniref:VC2046/SO_2500 family protein n=1 Tax=unclassified Psychromonas TaxID=2614957 RepID=UPI00339C4683
MNSKQLDNNLLINEWQLGQQLNAAVHNGTRDKFNLLLSFLSDDARDFAQFDLAAKKEVALETTASLRQQFQLPPAQPLVNGGVTLEQACNMNADLHNNHFRTIRLKQLLHNEALLARPEQGEFSDDIVDNISLVAQQRLSASLGNSSIQFTSTGVTNELMNRYQELDLDNKPIKVNYM